VEGGVPIAGLQKAGGMFGLLSAFFAWYIGVAGIADDSNRYVSLFVCKSLLLIKF